MKIADIKKKMLAHKDFYGGDIMQRDEIKKATSKKELNRIMDDYSMHLEMMAIDAMSYHDNFKRSLGLNNYSE